MQILSHPNHRMQFSPDPVHPVPKARKISFEQPVGIDILLFGAKATNMPLSDYVVSPVQDDSRRELERLSAAISGMGFTDLTARQGFYLNPISTRRLEHRLKYHEKSWQNAAGRHLLKAAGLNLNRILLIAPLSIRKYQVASFYYRKHGLTPLPTIKESERATRQFLNQLDEEYTRSVSLFRLTDGGVTNLTENSLAVYRTVVSMTAPLIFNMGFLDGIPHAGQVSRLAADQMRRFYIGFLPTERQILQAAIVGWLHDCKLDGKYSPENMATHPIVSAAVAWHVLNTRTVQEQLKKIDGLKQPEQRSTFVRQIVEAISLNNDSYYVLQNAILGKDDSKANGLVGKMMRNPNDYSAEAIKTLKGWAYERFKAPSKSDALHPVIPPSLDTYCTTRLEIKRQIQHALEHLGMGTGLYDEKGNEIIVPTKYLFSHHEEVSPDARLLALCLEFADNVLLAPHKIVPFNDGNRLEKITSALASLDKNFESLPTDVREYQQPFHRAILLSVLQASDAFRRYLGQGNGSLYDQFVEESDSTEISFAQVESDNTKLMQWLSRADTWGGDWSMGNVDPEQDPAFKELIRLLEKAYSNMRPVYAEAAIADDPAGRFKTKLPPLG